MEILKKIKDKLRGYVSDVNFEGANIVVYTENKEFFRNSEGKIKEIVDEIKKRVELRIEPKILINKEEVEKEIRIIVPPEAEITNILFDFHRSIVLIEAKK